jgi:hypothetical protein
LQQSNEEQELSYEAAAKIAVVNAKIAKGLESLHGNLEDYVEVLSTANKDSFEYAEAISEIAKSLELIFGVNVSADFISTYLEQIK